MPGQPTIAESAISTLLAGRTFVYYSTDPVDAEFFSHEIVSRMYDKGFRVRAIWKELDGGLNHAVECSFIGLENCG